MSRFVLYLLLICVLAAESLQAQQNEYENSRNYLGLQAGHLNGPSTRFFFHPNVCIDLAAGYLVRAQAIGGNFSLLGSIPTGQFKKGAIFFGGGYIGSREVELVSFAAKLGYRRQLGDSPFFLHAEWSPWFYLDQEFDPLGGALALSYAFKRKERRRKKGEPLNGFYNWALGAKIGTNMGISSRIFTSPRTAFHLDAQYEIINEVYDLSFHFTYNQPLGSFGLFAYAGVGGGFSPYQVDDGAADPFWEIGSHIGAIVGLEYNIFGLPFHIGAQLEPGWSDQFGFTPRGAALARYTFGAN